MKIIHTSNCPRGAIGSLGVLINFKYKDVLLRLSGPFLVRSEKRLWNARLPSERGPNISPQCVKSPSGKRFA